MKILFGGTFDPIHNGHVALALHVAKQFQQSVYFLPLNGTPNYKPAPQATLSQRLKMLQLIVSQYPEQLDIDYSETEFNAYSPTYLSLTRLRHKYGTNEPFYFIIGGDSLIGLTGWDNWQELFRLTNFIVALRPGYTNITAGNLPDSIRKRVTDITNYQPKIPHGQIVITDFTPIDISSTQIRRNFALNQTTDSMLPPAVNHYIHQQNLYTHCL